MISDSMLTPSFTINYRINDNTRQTSIDHRVDVQASRDEIRQLVEQGYLIRPALFPENLLEAMRTAVNRISSEELDTSGTELIPDNGHYIRCLMDKDPVFVEVLENQVTLSIARAVLGPQVWFDIEARVAFAGKAGQRVPWHIHHRVIPNPLPPFFSYPHAIHCLLYLDDVQSEMGPICILPGSHQWPHYAVPADDTQARPGEIPLETKAGDCLIMHANLWHRTLPSQEGCGVRRLLLFGYTPSWIKSDVARGIKPEQVITDALRKTGDSETRELLGEFYW